MTNPDDDPERFGGGSGSSLMFDAGLRIDTPSMELNDPTATTTAAETSGRRSAKLVSIGALAFGVLALSACGGIEFDVSFGEDGTGDVETRTIEVDDFTAIDLDSVMDADIQVDPDQPASLTFTTHPNLFDNLDAKVEANTLKLSIDDVGSADELKATIVVPTLTDFEASGAVSADITGVRDDVSFSIDGASDIDVSGADAVTITNVTVDVNGASSLNMTDLAVETARVDIDGASSVDANVSEEVTGSVSGAADLDVEGGGSIDVQVSGAASVN